MESRDWLSKIRSSRNPVAVHVRRGDFVRGGWIVCTPEYFLKAMDKMEKDLGECDFFVFSNDMAYCREIFKNSKHRVFYVDCNGNDQGFQDMALMKSCRHFIISNSSFSWWSAVLGDDPSKIVICPDRWFGPAASEIYKKESGKAMVWDGWITLPCV